ncbi:unnamed protein product [Alternaria alternata]
MRRLLQFRSKKDDAEAPAKPSTSSIVAAPASPPSVQAAGAVLQGLQVVCEGTNPVIDIVAVHGLNGHCEKTWTAGNGVDSVNWLRDLLPHDLPNARILSWGYDANTHSGSRALIYSDAARRGALGEHRAIKLSMYGILFMGTPHQGGSGVALGKLMVNVASVFMAADDRLLQHLERDSEWLQQQLGQYGPISGDFVTKFAFEEYATPTVLGKSIVVVPRASAVVPGAADGEPITIHADHIQMVKFGSKTDPRYRTVSGHLRVMAARAGDVIGGRWDTEGLADEDPNARKLAEELDGLPLALATAGAYFHLVSTSLAEYLQLYRQSWLRLQQKMPRLLLYEDRALYSMWNISLDHVKQQSELATKLLQLWAYFDNQNVWLELLQEGRENAPEWFCELMRDRLVFNKARLLQHANRCQGFMDAMLAGKEDDTTMMDAVHGLGNLYRNQGRLDEAKEMYERAPE